MRPDDDHNVYQRIGALTRELHDALHALGYDRKITAAVESLPDARDRLAYVASLTGQAADRVLSAVEHAQADQARLAEEAAALTEQWTRFTAAAAAGSAGAALYAATREFLAAVPGRTAAAQADLHQIMMAQDFHDLTGQVLKRIASVASSVEASLVELLVDARPTEAPAAAAAESLSGPTIRPSGDTVSSQGEVDDLLASLGF